MKLKINYFCKENLTCFNIFTRHVALLNGLGDIQHFYFCKTSSLETKLKEKLALFLRSIYSGTPGWFLYSTFMVGSSMFCTKESQFPKLGILRCLTVFAKKLFSSLATSSQFVNKELFSSSVRFILPRKRVFWRKRV